MGRYYKAILTVNIVAGIVASPNGAGRFEMLHVNKRLKDTGHLLETLLPLWSAYVEFPEPTGTAAKVSIFDQSPLLTSITNFSKGEMVARTRKSQSRLRSSHSRL